MIRITVVSYNNLAPTSAISALFGSEQGSIGRSDDNFLVLPDPQHCVSRAQAKVWSDGTHHKLINISLANPILINDQEIEPEREVAIHAGDQIKIGLYLLSVNSIEPDELGTSTDPAATIAPISKPETDRVTSPASDPPLERKNAPKNAPGHERRTKMTTVPPALASKTKTSIQPPQYLLRKDGMPGYIQDMFPATEPVERRLQPSSPISAPLSSSSAQAPSLTVQEASIAQPPLFTSPALELPTSANELLQAFLNGAGLPELNLSSGLTPELMETLGKLVATSVKGTMELISQRALVKREVNAEVTMVVLRKNNPLKFFPDSQTVLTQMLRKKMPGFMTPPEAMDDAFVDLRAHQLAVVVGMKAAMDALLKKLHPIGITNNVNAPTLLDYINPARRKAALWDQYSRVFNSISLESKDEFQSLFGKEFLAAYENEIERFKQDTHSANGTQLS